MNPHAPTAPLQVAIVGSPNAGKSSLFNSLTGIRSKTANYPGVTVSRREGTIRVDDNEITVVDLPGTYALAPVSPDEAIVTDSLSGKISGVDAPDALMIVADATSLRRSLFLVASLLELEKPTCLVLTMIDEVAARGGTVDTHRLSDALGIPVVGVVGHKGLGISQVTDLLRDPLTWRSPVVLPPHDMAERAAWVDSVAAVAVSPLAPDQRTRRIDNILLHRVFGIAIFATVMLLFFQTIFTVAAPIVDVIDGWVSSLAGVVNDHVPGLFGDFLADGVIGGVGSVLVFLPQITLLFLIIGILERIGYLARAALLADRVMGRFGLEGRSFIAMLSSFACAVPGIMSTRTIPDERRRIATMMSAPLMTCSARLPVFTLLISTFVRDRPIVGPLRSQGLALFGLYALGALSGLAYAAVISRTSLNGPSAPFMMELPPYRWPTVKAVLLHVWEGAWSFIQKAGTIILFTTAILWGLANLPRADSVPGRSDAQQASIQMEQSFAGDLGRALEPVFRPLGFDWRTNVAVIGSLAAREVFVSTLAVTTSDGSEENLPDRLGELTHSDGTPVYDGPTVAALLVFFVYALQCFSTVAVLRRESNSWRWPLLAVGSMFVMAYAAALIARLVVGALT